MTNIKLNPKLKIPNQNKKKYDLKDRIFKFVIDVLDYLDKLPRTPVNRVIIDQCARSSTSIGANYEEADSAHTKKDFSYKMDLLIIVENILINCKHSSRRDSHSSGLVLGFFI